MNKCDTCIIDAKARKENGCCIWYMDNVVCGDKSVNDCSEYIKDDRRCENCGRIDGWNGCGEYVRNCMQNYDAYSNWIPKDNIKEDF